MSFGVRQQKAFKTNRQDMRNRHVRHLGDVPNVVETRGGFRVDDDSGWMACQCFIPWFSRVAEAVPEGVPRSGKAVAERLNQARLIFHAASWAVSSLRFASSRALMSLGISLYPLIRRKVFSASMRPLANHRSA